MRTCPCYLLCELTSNKGTHRETGLPYLDSWKEERVAISSVCVLGRQRQWGPWACLAAPTHRNSHQTVGNPTEASVPDVVCVGHLGLIHGVQIRLGSQSCWERAPWYPASSVTPNNSSGVTVPATVPENLKGPPLPHPHPPNISQDEPREAGGFTQGSLSSPDFQKPSSTKFPAPMLLILGLNLIQC